MHFQGISCSGLWLLWSGLHIPAKEKKLQVKCRCDGGGVMCQTSSDVRACQKTGWNHSLCYSLALWRTEFRVFKPVTGIQKYSHADSVPGDMAGHFILLWILYFIYQCFEYYLSHKTPFIFTPFFSMKLGLCFLTGIFRCAWPKYMRRRW